MKKFFIAILLLMTLQGYSQKKIKGFVHDENIEAIPGVSVFLRGTLISSTTDINGKFTFIIPDSLQLNDSIKKQLELSFIGMKTLSIDIDEAKVFNISLSEDMEREFPWPPPNYTTSAPIEQILLGEVTRLRDVDEVLVKALNDNGYHDKSYFPIPNGFALATRIEQIDKNGISLEKPDRWNLKTVSNLDFNIASYLKALFFSVPGYFRIIVFAITDVDIKQSGMNISRNEAEKWFKGGYTSLPAKIGRIRYDSDYTCTALIYEFRKPENMDPEFIENSMHTGVDHLEKTKLISSLKKLSE
ncbi:hypothetical protein EMN47_12350 [Prolixibacteraceae bacterium JC049]|nr:hypothetical protein [Prolixibacteraceae bacterium JC049]